MGKRVPGEWLVYLIHVRVLGSLPGIVKVNPEVFGPTHVVVVFVAPTLGVILALSHSNSFSPSCPPRIPSHPRRYATPFGARELPGYWRRVGWFRSFGLIRATTPRRFILKGMTRRIREHSIEKFAITRRFGTGSFFATPIGIPWSMPLCLSDDRCWTWLLSMLAGPGFYRSVLRQGESVLFPV